MSYPDSVSCVRAAMERAEASSAPALPFGVSLRLARALEEVHNCQDDEDDDEDVENWSNVHDAPPNDEFGLLETDSFPNAHQSCTSAARTPGPACRSRGDNAVCHVRSYLSNHRSLVNGGPDLRAVRVANDRGERSCRTPHRRPGPDRLNSGNHRAATNADSRYHIMLNALRSWSKRFVSSSSQTSVDGARRSADDARTHRASEVTRLQGDIHRIQHEISDLNDLMNAGSDAVSSRANETRMATLHQQLAAKQRELGTYQARI